MDSTTPAKDIPAKDLKGNSRALEKLLDKIEVPATERVLDIRYVLDVRYGLGGWARKILVKFPQARIVGYEGDKDTFDQAWRNDSVFLIPDFFPNETDERYPKVDLVVADFNNVTQLNREDLDVLLKNINCRYLIFTDICCSKLHLNYQRYGLEEPSLEAYWKSFKVPGFRFVAYAQVHRGASTALWEQKKVVIRKKR